MSTTVMHAPDSRDAVADRDVRERQRAGVDRDPDAGLRVGGFGSDVGDAADGGDDAGEHESLGSGR